MLVRGIVVVVTLLFAVVANAKAARLPDPAPGAGRCVRVLDGYVIHPKRPPVVFVIDVDGRLLSWGRLGEFVATGGMRRYCFHH